MKDKEILRLAKIGEHYEKAMNNDLSVFVVTFENGIDGAISEVTVVTATADIEQAEVIAKTVPKSTYQCSTIREYKSNQVISIRCYDPNKKEWS